MTKKVLITGSSGFLGESVSREISEAGYQVKPFDICRGNDIMNFNQVLNAMKDCDICIHLAAVSDLYEADAEPKQCYEVNVNGTHNIALACLKTNTRLIYASTCCAYGNNDVEVSDESSPVAPTELYAQTKLQGEKVIAEVGCEYNILRLATFYGPKMRSSLATSVFLKRMLMEKPIEIHGDGSQTRCYTHVDDIASGIRIVLESTNAPKIINVSDEIPYSVNQLIDVMSKITGIKPVTKHVTDRAGQIKSSVISCNTLKKLGWQPKWDLISGLTDCMNEIKYKKNKIID